MKKASKQYSPALQFWKIIKPHFPKWWITGIAFILLIGEVLFSLSIPLLTMYLINEMVEISFNVNTFLLLIVTFLVQIILSGISLYMMIYVGQKVISGLRGEFWSHLLKLPVPFFDKYSSGDIMSRITNDTNVIKQFLTTQFIPFISGLISIIGSITLLFYLIWVMALILFIIAPVSFIIFGFLGKKMQNVARKLQDETADFQSGLGRVLGDIRLVKSSLAIDVEIKEGKLRISNLFHLGLREGKIMSIVTPLMTTISLVGLTVVFGYGGILVAKGELSAGALIAIVFYIFQIISPLSQLAQFFAQFQKAVGANNRIQTIMKEPPESSTETEVTNHATQDGIVFKNVHFSYNQGHRILNNISFVAPPGKVTALIGPSGAGKTTIFSLIERFYLPDKGSIFLNKIPAEKHDLQEWRKKFAYVSQDAPIMDGSILDNLTYGLDYVDKNKINHAIEQANLMEFIDSLPNKYSTQVGERGVRLSGGQRQRLAIARAIIRNPEILLLDEATAHLDSTSESLIQDALHALMVNRTTLIIAHRLSTIKNAHQIIVIEDGTVTGTGTNEDLYKNHKLYYSMANYQKLQV